MTLEELTEVAVKLARTLDLFEAPFLIGGGAVRDTLLGRPVKDIDVFVDDRKLVPEWERIVAEVAREFNATPVDSAETSVDAAMTTDLLRIGEPDIQLIPVGRDVFADVGDYDFGICQVAMTGNGTVLMTKAFSEDVEECTITYAAKNPSEFQVARSAKRLQRLLKKYPSFTPIGCSHLY